MKSTPEYTDAEKALQIIESGNRVFIHGSAQTPTMLINELAKQFHRLKNVEIVSITLYGDIAIAKKGMTDSFKVNSLFVSEGVRRAVNDGYADYVPIFLSEIPILFRRGLLPVDVALVQVSPPDAHGFCSLGLSVDIALAAVQEAKHVVALVNPNVPRTIGQSQIHHKRFHSMVFCNDALHESKQKEISEQELTIGRHIAGLIEDRSTLQTGIGSIPNAVLQSLGSHKDLGIHTEMFSDGVIDLIEKGIVTNKYKKIRPGVSVTSFALGTRRLYDFVNDNPSFNFLDVSFVNDPNVIRRIDKMVAINSAIEIDITGQVCSDSIGTYQYSGIGGQMDFLRGAALSEGGKPILALPSRTNKGIPRIVPFLKQGAGVVTTRAHVHYVVTEYGVAYLYGKNLRQRAKALIDIAHPDDREILEKAASERFKLF
ncbi:MAG: acetyl-CoA hydrolase/transferase family protein [Chitinophagaceae bacterium]|nr:acetyl-CoA hydrolase/transferase family protein [Chitinophagaceae bacterium]